MWNIADSAGVVVLPPLRGINQREYSMKKLILAAVLSAVFSMPAFANQCPILMGKIDEAMKTATIDDATKTKVMALYDSGKAKHESGDHAGSEADLNEALALLGM
jgi:hypothetical protein